MMKTDTKTLGQWFSLSWVCQIKKKVKRLIDGLLGGLV